MLFCIGKDNFNLTLTWMKNFATLLITNGYFAVDTFFLLSGVLVSFCFLKEVDKLNGKITPRFMIKYYLHRYWVCELRSKNKKIF